VTVVETDMFGRVILLVGKVSPFERRRRQGQSWPMVGSGA